MVNTLVQNDYPLWGLPPLSKLFWPIKYNNPVAFPTWKILRFLLQWVRPLTFWYILPENQNSSQKKLDSIAQQRPVQEHLNTKIMISTADAKQTFHKAFQTNANRSHWEPHFSTQFWSLTFTSNPTSPQIVNATFSNAEAKIANNTFSFLKTKKLWTNCWHTFFLSNNV